MNAESSNGEEVGKQKAGGGRQEAESRKRKAVDRTYRSYRSYTSSTVSRLLILSVDFNGPADVSQVIRFR